MIKKLIYKIFFVFIPLVGHCLRYIGIIRVNYGSTSKLNFRSKQATEFVKKKILKSKSILEYGSGNSTLFANKMNKKIYSVESDKAFYQYLKKKIKKNYFFVDFGPVYFYSIPLFENLRRNNLTRNAEKYSNKILNFLEKKKNYPDLILIDGRYRVLCALQVYKFIKKNKLYKTTVVLDDYKFRKQYHIVKKFYKIKLYGEIAELKYKNISTQNINKFIEKYLLKFN